MTAGGGHELRVAPHHVPSHRLLLTWPVMSSNCVAFCTPPPCCPAHAHAPHPAPLSPVQSEAAHFHQQLQDCQQRLSLLQEKHQKQTLELEAELREQAAAAQQDKLQQVAAVKSQLEK